MCTWKPWFAWHPVWVDGQQVWCRWVERALFGEYHTGPQWRYRHCQHADTMQRRRAAGA
jgi:hypothetical protein